jgi:hypothetical protein
LGACLLAMAQVWRERRDEALETAGSVMAAIEHNESFSGRGGELTLALVDKIAGRRWPNSIRATAASARSPSFLIRRRWTCCWRWR